MTQCKHCQIGTPLQHGIHMCEFHMEPCERSKVTQKFKLEPMERDTWHQPAKRVKSDAPFVVGGGR